jgi:hypothetical protein
MVGKKLSVSEPSNFPFEARLVTHTRFEIDSSPEESNGHSSGNQT